MCVYIYICAYTYRAQLFGALARLKHHHRARAFTLLLSLWCTPLHVHLILNPS